MMPMSISSCELGPIRPPSEATSLLFRVSRNCPWNKCAFCAVYKRTDFSRRSKDDLHAEIDLLARAAKKVQQRATKDADGKISVRAYLNLVNAPYSSDEERRVALWLSRGGRNVFLQDADSLVLPARRLVPLLEHLRESFPTIDRITTYARSRTLVARSPDQMATLKAAGLTRIHVGVESGSDAVLDLISKGCRSEHHITGCRRAVEAGFEVCCYVMPGLGGSKFSKEHARETARVLKAIDPQHVRLRTLWIDRGSPLEDMAKRGDFSLLEEDDVVFEIQRMLKNLVGASGQVISDHDRNLLMELEGHLTDDADKLQRLCTDFLNLPIVIRDAFVVARRSGCYMGLNDFLADRATQQSFADLSLKLRSLGDGSLIKGMKRGLRKRWI